MSKVTSREADLDCLMTLPGADGSQADLVFQILKDKAFVAEECWNLQDKTSSCDSDPETAFRDFLSSGIPLVMVSFSGQLADDKSDIIVTLDRDLGVVSVSLGDESLLRKGLSPSEDRLVAFLEILRLISVSLKPAYRFIGPETYSHEDVALDNAERLGLKPLNNAAFSQDEIESIKRFYGI